MSCGAYYQQLREIEKALGSIRRAGLPASSRPYQELYKLRGKILAQVSYKLPRTVTQLVRIAGLSPGILALWHDAESGFMVEARAYPGAPPVYHRVEESIAEDLLAGRHLHEYEEFYLRPPVGVDN